MGRPVTGHSICLCESSRSACVSGAVNTLHLVFAQRSNRALLRHKITLARVNGFHSWTAACTCGVGICTLFPEAELSFPRKRLLLCLLSWQECMWLLIRNDPSIHPRILTLAASFSRSHPCCLFFLLLWAEDAVLVWTSMMCYTTTRFQHGGAHHMRPDSKSITFPTSDAPTGSQLDANKQTKNKCQSLYLKTNAANVIWWASKHRLLLGGCWRLCGPVYETHLIFFSFLT